MDDEGEISDWRFLPANVVDSDFGIGDSSVVTRLRIRLSPANSVASGWSSAHNV